MTKREIVETMVANGYHLMGQTVESMSAQYTEEQLLMFLEAFTNWKQG